MAAHTMVHVIWKPKFGPNFQMVFHIKGVVLDPTDANLQAVLTAINACTRAIAIEIALSVWQDNETDPTISAVYVNEDKAALKAIDEDGQPHNWRLPSVIDTLVASDRENIAIDTGPFADLVDAIGTYARDPGGGDITTVVSAHRVENRKRLKAGSIS